jgi:hypothetical protein
LIDPFAALRVAFEDLLAQVRMANGYLNVIFHPNLVVGSLIEKSIMPLSQIWFGFILQTTDMGSKNGSFVGNATIQQFEPKVQVVADAALVLIAMWSAYRIMWGHGLFTQYTARILLPRLFMAAVLINFPLMLFQFAIDASNTVSASIQNTISIEPPASLLGGLVPADPLQLVTIAALAAAYDVFAVVYVLRYAILIVLAITAPIAGLLFMLPETNHISKLWMSHFTTNLFMQPMQLFVLAIGFALERGGISPIRHLFAVASLFIVFKVPGAMGGSEKVAHKLESTVSKGFHHIAHAVAKV